MIVVERGDPRHPQATALLEDSHFLMSRLFRAEENHNLKVEDLVSDSIRFFVARRNRQIVGTGALRVYRHYGELKSMFVAPAARGSGVGTALLYAIEEEARFEKLPILKLETGNLLTDALRLYERHGFKRCGPFASYAANSSSIFMEKKFE